MRSPGVVGKRVERSPKQLKQTVIAILEMRCITDPTVNFKECITNLKKRKKNVRRKNKTACR